MLDGATLPLPLLADHLQRLTEGLAAAQTQDDVLTAALSPAMNALNALAGAFLLLDPQRQWLSVAALQGSQPQTVWQDGPLTQETPAGDALTSGQALYFEHAGALKATYPELEQHTGGVTAVATVILPLRLGERALGVLILDFREPHEFTLEERRFLTILAAQSSVALDRVRLIAALSDQVQQRTTQLSHQSVALEAEQAALQAFVGFTEAASQTEDVAALGRLALDTLQHVLPGSSGVFYTRTTTWQPLNWTPDLAPDLLSVLRQGLPLDTPIFAELLQTRQPVFVDGWIADEQQVEHTGQFQTAAVYPIEQNGDICAVLSVALRHRPRWTSFQQGLVRAIGRSFTLLYDRIAVLEQLRQQRAEVEGRERVLELLSLLMTQLSTQQGDYALIQRAQEQVLNLLPPGHAAYWEPVEDHWQLRAYVNDVGNAALMAQIREGLPMGKTPTLDRCWTTGEAVFLDTYLPETDVAAELTTHTYAMAALPIGQGEHRQGVINFISFQPHHWTTAERALLRTLAQGLGSVLERAAQTRQLEEERAGLAAFAAFTEAVGVESDVPTLARQAVAALQTTLPGLSVAYHECVENRWVVQAWSEDVPSEVVAQMQAGVAETAPDFAQAVHSGRAVFVEGWDAPSNELPEASMYGAAGFLPLTVAGQTYSLLTVGLREEKRWSERGRSIVRAVAQGLTLALERAHAAQDVLIQKQESEQRRQALEAFAELPRTLPEETNRYVLIRRAQEIMLSLLTPGYALYWEAGEDRWHLKSQVGDIGDPALQAFVDEHGLPLDAPALHSTWRTGIPKYQDNYAQGADTPPDMIRHVQAATAFQVRMHGQPLGMLAIGLFDQRHWTSVDKAALETAIYSLGLVLERAQGLEALASRTAELERVNQELHTANDELEAFTYSASHDLRTPVRHVKGFTEMALRALDKNDVGKARRYHQVVSEAADRMTALIDAMLVLSRAGRVPIHLREVDLRTVITQAQRDVQMEFPDQTVDWQLGPLPVVQADPQLLQQVLTNLLSNAVKYSQGREHVTVEVWTQEQPGEIQVFVRDNGVGFNPEYADKLFGVFQRLHRQEEFQGTGVGLATVRRLITRHGGRVWGEGTVQGGATFGFALPR
ncbi:GAF domain-containing protein [Deinococcus sp. Leaf326]|uniref:GAF domain-containing protein n=1 Tax=Deinococcus sp. Leaf326 TaxID=1736338 RepID=UPI0007022FCF|nr:GAF domain-containing protein [Deinococcus sp. Leaf326]KQR04125.1 hypothetical protein ASF71_21280 [Deinococcus sp. Leaf326]